MKKEFEFQRYYKRWLGALPCLAIAIVLNFLLELLSLNKTAYFVLCVAIMFVLLFVYYAISEKWQLFRSKGYYWIENDILFIQVDNKTYKVTGVTELLGDVKSVYHSRYTVLLIEMGKTKIKLFSAPIEQEQTFQDSSLYPLYCLILSRAQDLEPVKVLNQDTEYWYKKHCGHLPSSEMKKE
jgi:hypothetical protein